MGGRFFSSISPLGTATSRRVNSFMRSKAEGSGLSFAGALGDFFIASPFACRASCGPG